MRVLVIRHADDAAKGKKVVEVRVRWGVCQQANTSMQTKQTVAEGTVVDQFVEQRAMILYMIKVRVPKGRIDGTTLARSTSRTRLRQWQSLGTSSAGWCRRRCPLYGMGWHGGDGAKPKWRMCRDGRRSECPLRQFKAIFDVRTDASDLDLDLALPSP